MPSRFGAPQAHRHSILDWTGAEHHDIFAWLKAGGNGHGIGVGWPQGDWPAMRDLVVVYDDDRRTVSTFLDSLARYDQRVRMLGSNQLHAPEHSRLQHGNRMIDRCPNLKLPIQRVGRWVLVNDAGSELSV